MKLCDTCIYRNEDEYHKPCIVYRDDCEYYEREEDMTREQAIMTLIVVDENATCDDCLYYNQMEDCPNDEDCIIRQALDVALEALEQEPCGDCVSRQAVQTELKNCKVVNVRDENDNFIGYYNADTVDSIVRNLSSVNPQEPSETIHGSTYGGVSWGGTYKTQKPKTGHWKSTIDGKPICSECGFVSESEDGYFVSHYCPNCGAKMVEPQESEDEE